MTRDDALFEAADTLAELGHDALARTVRDGALALRDATRAEITLDELVAEAAENERLAHAPVRRAGLRVLEGGLT